MKYGSNELTRIFFPFFSLSLFLSLDIENSTLFRENFLLLSFFFNLFFFFFFLIEIKRVISNCDVRMLVNFGNRNELDTYTIRAWNNLMFETPI